MHNSKIIGNFFQENEWKVLKWLAYSPNLNPIEKFLVILMQRFKKQTVFWKNLEKMYEIWNEIDPDVVRNLYENYRNRPLDVKKNYRCNNALLENKIRTENAILFDVCIAF